jgi:hypothetical protein
VFGGVGAAPVLNAAVNSLSDSTGLKTFRFTVQGIAFVALGVSVVGAGLLIVTAPKVYQAVARTKVSPPAFPGPWSPQAEFEVIASEAVLGNVIERLELAEQWGRKRPGGGPLKRAETLDALKRKLLLGVVPNTELLEIRVRSDGPAEEAKLANTIAETFVDYRRDQNRRIAEQTAPPPSPPKVDMIVDPMVEIVDRASVSLRPIGPNQPLGASACLLGLFLMAFGLYELRRQCVPS